MNLPTAYLFDMDGTLCQTEHLHLEALRQTLSEYGDELDTTLFERQLAGQTTTNVFRTLLPELSDSDRNIAIKRKEGLFRDMARNLTPTPGVVDFLNWIADRGANIALVTNAPRNDVHFVLEVLDMRDRFPSTIIAAELAHPKPHPLPYLRALAACRVDAGSAIAFEDSLAGVSSATTAGIKTVGITSTLSSAVLLGAGASMTIDDFRDLRLKRLAAT